ncbi:hypothetical protein [uncultured Parolsenella sp.]|uniref:hypothetical protein n=1 Tax=uncultured Parolsenella sp. TaxID=2083008 RepID=UPI0025F8D5F7|nr:hypothetical protein [uncultured Parolsenella sp.]
MAHMKVRYLGETSFLELTQGKVYEVISVEKGRYRLIDDSGEDYLYSPDEFEVISADDGPTGDE